MERQKSFNSIVYHDWRTAENLMLDNLLRIDGSILDISSVAIVSRFKKSCRVVIDEIAESKLGESVDFLESRLAQGDIIYGVNTGFGGSCDTRTRDLGGLQNALLQHQHSALVATTDEEFQNADLHGWTLPAMPIPWTKAAILIRANSLIRGHSGVPAEIPKALLALLENDLTPIVPLRGSISASGDLMPLSYIAGAIQGSPDVFMRTGKAHGFKIMSAEDALKACNLRPTVLGPKAGLALINGTAVSAATAALAMYDIHQLTVMCHALTAMATEALCGSSDSTHPFVAEVRPHPGQTESARAIRAYLQGTKLVELNPVKKDRSPQGLMQNRYALRGASQWLGPQTEDLMLAHQQISIELNSTTDNPLIDAIGGDIYSASNFQAVSVTSAMEKARLCLQMMGKLLFSQCSELINPDLSNGLPPNLAADDPSLSFTLKGVDVNMAAYMSELAYLASPVSSHVQSAEMHNQSINSLALISARYTMQSVDIVSLMCSCALYACCQALDLRVMHLSFYKLFRPKLIFITADIFGQLQDAEDGMSFSLSDKLTTRVWEAWSQHAKLDLAERCTATMESSIPILVNHLASKNSQPTYDTTFSPATIEKWKVLCASEMQKTFDAIRSNFFKSPHTADSLGFGAKKLYNFVRHDLGVPFHRGYIETPLPGEPQQIDGRPKKNIGSWIKMIHLSLKDGTMQNRLMELLQRELKLDGCETNGINGTRKRKAPDDFVNGHGQNGHL